MTRNLFAGLLSLEIVMSAPIGAQNTADTAAAKKQLKSDQQANKQQSKQAAIQGRDKSARHQAEEEGR